MSGTIVSTTTCIMETTMAFSIEMLTSRKLRQDRPRGLAESEALENVCKKQFITIIMKRLVKTGPCWLGGSL